MLIAQLSDIHVRPSGELYKGVADSNRMFSEAIGHLHGLDRRPDLVLLTGDLVDEGLPAEYASLRQLLSELTIPYLVLPGNHDDRAQFRACFHDQPYLPEHGPLHYCIDEYPVRIIALDSCVPGKHHGDIDPAGIAWLRDELRGDPTRPTLVLLHHPPFACGIPYLDQFRYVDAHKLASVLAEFSNVEAVLCGHVHRPMVRRWARTVVLACPSTTTQIALQLHVDASPQSFIGPSACMLHLWRAGEGLVSHTSYIDRYPGPYPFF
ncbi:MAG: phosphodiesterase [Burkholderiaceae bacterium]